MERAVTAALPDRDEQRHGSKQVSIFALVDFFWEDLLRLITAAQPFA